MKFRIIGGAIVIVIVVILLATFGNSEKQPTTVTPVQEQSDFKF